MSENAELPGRLGGVGYDGELPARQDLGLVFDELDYQMACQVYLWALPLVSYAQWQRVHREVFGAGPCDLVRYSTYRDRLGLITANATTPYILNFFDLAQTGPLLVELPAGPTAGGVSDFWQREIGVMGEMGPDRGQGGTHLIVPPGQPVPDGTPGEVHVLYATGMNVMFGFRTLDPDPDRSRALVDAVRIRPHDSDPASCTTRIVTPDGRPWSGDQPRGLEFFRTLHAVYQSEIVDERDRFYLAMLHRLGITKGEAFTPDERTTRILEQGAAAGELMAQANTFAKRFEGCRWWPDRLWDQPIVLDHSDQRAGHLDQLLERASWFYEAVSFSEAMKSHTPGAGQAYLGAYTDGRSAWLDGGRDYTLHVPADVPAKLFWSVTVYDTATRCLIDNPQQRGDRGSRDHDLLVNGDGSVDLSFGPHPPKTGESNWVQTLPGRHWFSYFRLYGPQEPYLDRTWKLGDITPA
ncbi:DUF1254 domain-containing protein [Streptomyces sp. NBC_00247]|uniref:DUF1254 domain-containing protein n=1 Tax=Streptomyces sp. NBC_00247 TaxID=2975689 RepID=UPI002E2A50A3|nr:DUF1254 domain-containing protein [Streptomyces sp. NBC_00247]